GRNCQYVETARAKGLPESALIMNHAVPNALHPLVAYQGVVLPYMLTGEIEVAIVFGLATVGPAIVGSMGVGDVYVTATFMLVLATTLIIGNIIADLLLVALDPRIRLGGDAERPTARTRPRPTRKPNRCRPIRAVGHGLVPRSPKPRWHRVSFKATRVTPRWSGAASSGQPWASSGWCSSRCCSPSRSL